MTLREYVLRWQEAYDKPQSRPTTYSRTTFSPDWERSSSLN